MNRSWGLVILVGTSLLFALEASAQPTISSDLQHDALLLIRSERASPTVRPGSYRHRSWVVWPKQVPDNPLLSLLSLRTGKHWDLSADHFVVSPGTAPKLVEQRRLAAAGVFQVENQFLNGRKLVASRNRKGELSAATVVITGSESSMPTLKFGQPPPDDAVIVMEIETWDEAAESARKLGGRILVVELPSPAQSSWTRIWQFGRNWPRGVPTDAKVGIPGLVDSRKLLTLLTRPDEFRWSENAAEWGNASDLLHFVNRDRIGILGAMALLWVYVAGCCAYLLVQERRGWLASWILTGSLLTPATILVAGASTQWIGPQNGLLSLLGSAVLLAAFWITLWAILWKAWNVSSPFLSLCWVSLVVAIICDSRWSLYSAPLIQPTLQTSGPATGLLFGSLTGCIAFARAVRPQAAWPARFLCGILFAWGLLLDPFWVAGDQARLCLPIVALLAGEGLLRSAMLPFLVLLPLADSGLREGFVLLDEGRIRSSADLQRYDLGVHWRFLTSPATLAGIGCAVFFFGLRERFLMSKLKRSMVDRAENVALGWCALGMSALGVLHPELLSAALLVAVGWVTIGLLDALQTHELA
jgi:hypothetical protein